MAKESILVYLFNKGPITQARTIPLRQMVWIMLAFLGHVHLTNVLFVSKSARDKNVAASSAGGADLYTVCFQATIARFLGALLFNGLQDLVRYMWPKRMTSQDLIFTPMRIVAAAQLFPHLGQMMSATSHYIPLYALAEGGLYANFLGMLMEQSPNGTQGLVSGIFHIAGMLHPGVFPLTSYFIKDDHTVLDNSAWFPTGVVYWLMWMLYFPPVEEPEEDTSKSTSTFDDSGKDSTTTTTTTTNNNNNTTNTNDRVDTGNMANAGNGNNNEPSNTGDAERLENTDYRDMPDQPQIAEKEMQLIQDTILLDMEQILESTKDIYKQLNMPRPDIEAFIGELGGLCKELRDIDVGSHMTFQERRVASNRFRKVSEKLKILTKGTTVMLADAVEEAAAQARVNELSPIKDHICGIFMMTCYYCLWQLTTSIVIAVIGQSCVTKIIDGDPKKEIDSFYWIYGRLGSLVGGYLSQHYGRRTTMMALMFPIMFFLLLGPSIIEATQKGTDMAVALPLVRVVMFCLQAIMAILPVHLMEIAQPRVRTTYLGFCRSLAVTAVFFLPTPAILGNTLTAMGMGMHRVTVGAENLPSWPMDSTFMLLNTLAIWFISAVYWSSQYCGRNLRVVGEYRVKTLVEKMRKSGQPAMHVRV